MSLGNPDMYILGVESSRTRGMGHLFHALQYATYLDNKSEPYLILINDDAGSLRVLNDRHVTYKVVNYDDISDWPGQIVREYRPSVWLQDKFTTNLTLANQIRRNDVLFCMVDEFGPAARMCDLHFGGMLYMTGNKVLGKRVCYGPEYVIINKETEKHRRVRSELKRIIVTLGGSDPYGASVEVVEALNATDYEVEVVIGPNFAYREELQQVNKKNYPVKQYLPSLVSEMNKFDFAITGGGVTCCEASAIGLPCLIIANAPHEVQTGKHMEKLGCAIFAGEHGSWDRSMLDKIAGIDVTVMSKSGLNLFDARAVERIFSEIELVIES